MIPTFNSLDHRFSLKTSLASVFGTPLKKISMPQLAPFPSLLISAVVATSAAQA
jgi:hypothetical protein